MGTQTYVKTDGQEIINNFMLKNFVNKPMIVCCPASSQGLILIGQRSYAIEIEQTLLPVQFCQYFIYCIFPTNMNSKHYGHVYGE